MYAFRARLQCIHRHSFANNKNIRHAQISTAAFEGEGERGDFASDRGERSTTPLRMFFPEILSLLSLSLLALRTSTAIITIILFHVNCNVQFTVLIITYCCYSNVNNVGTFLPMTVK